MAFSIIFYNAILLFSTLFVWLSEKASTPMQRRVCTVIAFLIVFLPSALRYEIGIDYFSYQIIFENIRNGVDLFWQSKMEPGFYFLNWLVATLGLGFEWFIAIVAFIITYFLFRSYPQSHKALFHLVLWAVIYVETFNTLRSMLAGSVLLYAVMQHYKYQNNGSYFLRVAIATLFHKSALLFIVIPFFSRSTLIKNSLKIKIVLPVLLILFFALGQNVIDFVFDSTIVKALGFATYVDSWYNKETELGSGLGVLAVVSFLAYSVYVAIKSREKNYLTIIVVGISSITVILAAYVTIFYRLKLLFIIAYPIAVWFVVKAKPSTTRYIIIVGFVFLNIFNFNRTVLSGSTDYIETCSGARITPYVSVFNKEDSTRDPHLTRFARWCNAYFEKN